MVKQTPVALVTGASRRVGRAVALRLARGGYDLAVSFHNGQAEVRSLAKLVDAMGRRFVAIRADLTDTPAGAMAVADEVRSVFGRVDVLVNNASLYQADPDGVAKLVGQMRLMQAIHVDSPLVLVKELTPLLRKGRLGVGGCVINMVDILADRPMRGYLGYCASKAGLANLTLALARELAPKVRVLGIAPGVVAWPDDMPTAARQEYLKRVPLARSGTPEDVANLVWFLVTQGTYMTGQIVRLDGGRGIV